MWNNGYALLWNHVSKMFYTDIEDGLHLLPRISTDHIELTSYSVMRVNLASHLIFSIIDQRGKLEQGAGDGVYREVFSCFWLEFSNSMTIGERKECHLSGMITLSLNMNQLPEFLWLDLGQLLIFHKSCHKRMFALLYFEIRFQKK